MKSNQIDFSEIVRYNRALLKMLLDGIRLLSQPIDFADLQRRGILWKEGAWYRAPRLWGIPDHATRKTDKFVSDAKGFRVTFYPASRYEKIAKRVEKIAAEEGLLTTRVPNSVSSSSKHESPATPSTGRRFTRR